MSVDLPTPRGALRAVDNVDLSLAPGRTLGVVGESGCGKTMLSRAILQLLPKRARLSGRVMLGGRDLATLPAEALRRLRGPELAVVFQDPMTSLNPVLTIGTQIIETLQAHLGMDARRCGGAQRRASGGGRHPGAGSAEAAAISPSAFRRHAPEGGDRHRACPASPSS